MAPITQIAGSGSERDCLPALSSHCGEKFGHQTVTTVTRRCVSVNADQAHARVGRPLTPLSGVGSPAAPHVVQSLDPQSLDPIITTITVELAVRGFG